MVSTQAKTFRPSVGEGPFVRAAHLAVNAFGSPEERGKTSPAVATPARPKLSISDSLLPEELTEILAPSLELLRLQLEQVKTPAMGLDQMISHYVVQTATGGIVLLHLEADILQAGELWTALSTLGFVFDAYTALFIFSYTEQVADEYGLMLSLWRGKAFERAEIFPNGYIQRLTGLAQSDPEFVAHEIQETFGLPKEPGNGPSTSPVELAAEPTATVADDASPTQKDLYKLIAKTFSLEEIQELAFELDVPFEDIGGATTRRNKALELQEYMTRRGRLEDLLAAVAKARKSLDLTPYGFHWGDKGADTAARPTA